MSDLYKFDWHFVFTVFVSIGKKVLTYQVIRVRNQSCTENALIVLINVYMDNNDIIRTCYDYLKSISWMEKCRSSQISKTEHQSKRIFRIFPYKSHSIQPSQPRKKWKIKYEPPNIIPGLFHFNNFYYLLFFYVTVQYFLLLLSVYSTLRMLSFTLLPCMLTFFYFPTHSIISYAIFTVLVYTSPRFFIPSFNSFLFCFFLVFSI